MNMSEEQILNQFLNGGEYALEGLAGGLLAVVIIFSIIAVAAAVVVLIGTIKLFQKAGKPGWAAIVPFYNIYVLVEIAGLNWWYFLIAISGTICGILGIKGLSTITWLASSAVNFFIFYNLGKKFKKDPVTYGILGLFFFGIMAAVLGFSKDAKYDSSAEVSPNGPIDGEKTKATTSTSAEPERFCLGCGKKLKADAKFCENCGKKVEE